MDPDELPATVDNLYFDDIYRFNTFMKVTTLKNHLTVLHLNVRRISRFHKFMDLIDFINSLKMAPDVLIFDETWITLSTERIYKIHGYVAQHVCRDNLSAGISVFIKKCYENQIIVYNSSNGVVNFLDFTLVKVFSNQKDRRISCFYMPKKIDYGILLHILEQILSTARSNKHLVVGDFNLDINRPDNIVNSYTSLLNSYGYYLTNTNITRPASNSIIDHVWCNEIENMLNSTINTSLISDHNCTITFIDNINNNKDKTINAATFERTNFNEMNQIIYEFFNINHDYCYYTPDQMLDFIYETIYTAHSFSTNINHVIFNKKQSISPWSSKLTIKLSKKKKILLKKTKINPTNFNLKTLLRTTDRELKESKVNDRTNYFNSKFEPNISTKNKWSNINNILGRKSEIKTINKILTSDMELITCKTEICSYLNQFWLEKSKKLNNLTASRCNDATWLPVHGILKHYFFDQLMMTK